jgi:hypothetical protein
MSRYIEESYDATALSASLQQVREDIGTMRGIHFQTLLCRRHQTVNAEYSRQSSEHGLAIHDHSPLGASLGGERMLAFLSCAFCLAFTLLALLVLLFAWFDLRCMRP